MLEDGKYIAWFRTALAQGTGAVTLAKGQITGEDTVIAYSSTYEQEGDHFTATFAPVATAKVSLRCLAWMRVKLEGRPAGQMVVCKGTADQAPGLTFSATLIRSREEPFERSAEQAPIPAFRDLKLPKPHGER